MSQCRVVWFIGGSHMKRRTFVILSLTFILDIVGAAPAPSAQSDVRTITPIPFEEMNGERVYNASGVAPLADYRFLFCYNNCNDALFEFDLTKGGRKKGTCIRR